MKITPFLALTILAKVYRHGSTRNDKDKYEKIKKLYLSGVTNKDDEKIYAELMKDSALRAYQIDESPEAITNEPSRRYFESVLCVETLSKTINKVDLTKLQRHFESIFSLIDEKRQSHINKNIYSKINKARERKLLKNEGIDKEYYSVIREIQTGSNFESLASQDKDGKEKLTLIMKCAHASMKSVTQDNEKFPLNLYKVKSGPYSEERRGRVERKDYMTNDKQTVLSQNLGIMRSYHPLFQSDSLFARQPEKFVRCPDRSDYLKEAEQPVFTFSTKVAPFVNSISGTMLVQLRAMARLLDSSKFEYENNENQLEQYIKMLISSLLLMPGGHSLREFMIVFSLPEVKSVFSNLGSFNERMTLDNLFKDENSNAFEAAMDKTIQYNDALLKRRMLHDQLTSQDSTKILQKPIVEPREEDEKKKNRLNLLKMMLYGKYEGTVAKKIDKAWKIYCDDAKEIDDRLIAQDFLIYALDIAAPEDDLNDQIIKKMEDREKNKIKNPAYLPGWQITNLSIEEQYSGGERPIAKKVHDMIEQQELLGVSELARRKDSGELTGKLTIMYEPVERAAFEVIIRNGKFMKEGRVFDTTFYQSHDKPMFAAFTLNLNGELSVFDHINHDLTGIAHSSLNRGDPVVCAGELQIINGKITAITAHSGHYRPTAYNLSKTLSYFESKGVDISDTKVYLFQNPSKKLSIQAYKSEEYPRFYVANASELTNSFKLLLRNQTLLIRNRLENHRLLHQGNVFERFMDGFLGFFGHTTARGEHNKQVGRLIKQIAAIENKISKAVNKETLEKLIDELGKVQKLARKELDKKMPKNSRRREEKLRKELDKFKQSISKLKKYANDSIMQLDLQKRHEGKLKKITRHRG